MKTSLLKPLLLLLALSLFSACSDDDDSDTDPNPAATDLTGKLNADSRFSLFVDALKRTGLDASLDAGTYTVFAPTDAAFNAWISDMGYTDLDALEMGMGSEALQRVVAYHIIKGRYLSTSLQSGYSKSLGINNAKDTLRFYLEAGAQIMLNDQATVEDPNLVASNGVIHALNGVNMPLSVYGLLAVNPSYSSLEAAIGLADGNLNTVLADPSLSITLFAPNNTAFDSLVAQTPNVNNLFELVADMGTDELATLIYYHASGQVLMRSELQTGSLNTLADNGSGGKLSVFINIGSSIRIIDNSSTTEDAVLTSADIVGTNGVLHLIDGVLLFQ
jgi:uncharacterized surface protein with fasciclin (FAS1) repeats